jgi:hypothetical protein
MEKNQEWKNEQPLDPSLHFGFPNHELPFKFCLNQLGFPSKMMPCRLHHNLICFGPRPLGVGMVRWTNFGVAGVFFFVVGVIARVCIFTYVEFG